MKTWKRGAAPGWVRIAALSSFFLGQMIVPGVLAALVGLVVVVETIGGGHSAFPLLYVMLLSAPTGVLVAAYLLSAGSAMLGRADDAAGKARRAARWALGHNLVLLVGLGLAAAMERDEVDAAIGPALYACLSIAQALLVQRAAVAIDAYASRQAADPAPIEAEVEILHGVG